MGETSPYLFLTLFLGVAIAFPLIPILLARAWAWKFSPAKPGPEKTATYECGIETGETVQIQYNSQFYLYGIIFLIFDVEAVFLLPVAVAFLDLPVGAVLAMLVFVLLLVEGLAWAWAKGVLT